MPGLAHWIDDKSELLRIGAPLRIGPIATLELGMYHRWEPRQVFVIITAYGDESGTHDDSPNMMLAGHVSTLGQWNRFDIGYQQAIQRAGLPGYFHATEHWDTEAGAKFAPLLRKLEKKYVRFGYVIELDKDSYEQYYVAGNRPKKPQLDTRYALCFRFLGAFLITRLPVLLGRNDITLNIVLEEGAVGAKDCHRIVQEWRKLPETQDIAQMLSGVSFAPKKKFPGLQVSDALSFGAWKIAPTGPEMVDLPQDVSLASARSATQWKPTIFHCRLDQPILESFKNDILTLVDIRKRIAADAAGTKP
jgi:hypothetical protein